MADGSGLSPDIVEAIAISNAKSIGEQPAILANLALANQIANLNLAQQNGLNNQQAAFQLQMATAAKCVELVVSIDPKSSTAAAQLKAYASLMDVFNAQIAAIGGKGPGGSAST